VDAFRQATLRSTNSWFEENGMRVISHGVDPEDRSFEDDPQFREVADIERTAIGRTYLRPKTHDTPEFRSRRPDLDELDPSHADFLSFDGSLSAEDIDDVRVIWEEDVDVKRKYEKQWLEHHQEALTKHVFGQPSTSEMGMHSPTVELHRKALLEQQLYELHKDMDETGLDMMSCLGCGQRSPEITREGCPTCISHPPPPPSRDPQAARIPGKYTIENFMSLAPPVSQDAQVIAERAELVDIWSSMTMMEIALCRPAANLVSLRKLPKGQFAYRGHCISLQNNISALVASLPRSAKDCGVTIVVSRSRSSSSTDAPTVEEFLQKHPELTGLYRVRRRVVARCIYLMTTHHRYANAIYGAALADAQALSDLPEDGVPNNIPIIYEERASLDPGPGELFVLSTAFARWLEAGDEEYANFPIAAEARRILHDRYDLTTDLNSICSAIQGKKTHEERSDRILIPDLVHFLAAHGVLHSFEATFYDPTLQQSARRGPDNPIKFPAQYYTKGLSNTIRKQIKAQVLKEERTRHQKWKSVDDAVAKEFENLAQLGYAEDESCVPSNFVPRRSTADRKNDQLGLLLGDEERSNSGGNTWSRGMKRVRVFQPPALGAPIDERTQGFWSLCYPELFPFGYGCFNEPRSVEVDWTEWASWVIHQDFGILRSRLKGNALPLQISLESTSEVIRKATDRNTKVEFKGSPKRRGTKSFDRWSRYSSATTVSQAISLGATAADIRHDYEHGLMLIASGSSSFFSLIFFFFSCLYHK